MKPQLLLSLTLIAILALPPVTNGQKASERRTARPRNPVFAPVEDTEGLPRILLIGDSISIAYTLPVRALLEGKANVHRPPTNCGPTIKGLEELDHWLATGGTDKRWDVIHFNWGLHDLKYMGPNGENLADPQAPDSRQQVPPAEYGANLRKLVERLKQTDAKLIWRNTTPVPEGVRGRIPGDSVKYNAIAAPIMKEHGIPTHDLYRFASDRQAEIQRPADVHFTPAGSKALAKQVVAEILKALERTD